MKRKEKRCYLKWCFGPQKIAQSAGTRLMKRMSLVRISLPFLCRHEKKKKKKAFIFSQKKIKVVQSTLSLRNFCFLIFLLIKIIKVKIWFFNGHKDCIFGRF
jgi:hypothetical protein